MARIEQRSSVLDLVRRTCQGAEEIPDFEGVYEPEPEQVEAWKVAEATDFGGKTRFLNLPPGEVQRRLDVATDAEEIEALRISERMWRKNGGYGGQMVAGSVDRGEARVAIRAGSMRELVGKNRAVAVTVGGTLRAGGMPTVLGEPPAAGELGRLVDMVDWDLLAQGPVPVPKKGEDWF